MEQCNKSRHALLTHLRKLLPTIILLVLTGLAGGTNLFSADVHQLISKSLSDRATELMPYLLNILLLITAVNIAWLLYHPLICWATRLINLWSIRQELKSCLLKGFRLGYWLVVIFFVVASFAPDLMGKLAEGAMLVAAALGVALQSLVIDFCCGILLQTHHCLHAGDWVKLSEGVDASGMVKEIGYMRTIIVVNGRPETVRNSKLWDCHIAHTERQTTLVLPDEPPAK